MNKIQAVLLCIISAVAGTAILFMDHTDSSWIGRVVICYSLIITFGFLGYYDKYLSNIRTIRVTANMLVEHSNETPETVRNMIEIARADESLTEDARNAAIDGYGQVLHLFNLYKSMPTLEELLKVSNNCWYMSIISTIILLINVTWVNETFSSTSTLILMVVYIILLMKNVNIMKGKDNGKGKTDLWK